ncbi:nitrite reductase [Nocardiopsis changdeensis]|uniref:Nitrite reductase n=1 Tax=Nocardiopsis changdeensis TaxID=2831969 RepID=A0ABX8BWN6_9ACTN|nr:MULTISPECIES: nitrite reductase [Nocardiopsis]QUX25236.1 nitrite reductase [Nocardiopsis changdeensis]QYX35623.1 nitrite reductase [Nocardiopsis sp. MT53]
MFPADAPAPRSRRDRCPGALRPWEAPDGLLVRLRLVGGRLPARSLAALAAVAEEFGSGRVHVTGRANLQVRALPGRDGRLDPAVLGALEETGLLPSPSHELVRNVMASPLTGLSGGRADLRPVAAALDAALCSAPHRAALPGRFLFVLDDGRGDLVERPCDLGLTALDGATAQLRVGDRHGSAVRLDGAADALVRLADLFLERRGDGPSAPWHVAELPSALCAPHPPDPRLPAPAPPPPYGPLPGGAHHVPVPEEGLDRVAADALAAAALAAGGDLVVTPWRGVVVPGARR